ncbi:MULTISPECIES: hypothetical protein [Pseudomonas]|jgi:hypothetical protein|uniref:hypothetical protein n=1 Tax=Pseudomonas TaxID=286 RepID=UPI000875F909|nr:MULTISPECIES: hypothetical protein [Pseudomonas]MDB6444592.1 hypothetical protein [Pseudomonas sp. 21TX0197]MDT8905262.1 hypothetical protein [Pseudomonas prosekii]NHN66655.1 hypothetical protein [Pseudomonas fluorescens]ROO31069.1 hypothetical protein BIV09_04420 [Pseudomonas sp. 7SR1]ROO42556.1 hypothetical protein BIV08_10455 [Pseudomonas sp. AF76]
MTSPTPSSADERPSDHQLDSPAGDVTATADAKAAIPAFKFPFKPGELAAAKGAGQLPWYKNGVKDGHTKTPGAAPPGTRRSMGKR